MSNDKLISAKDLILSIRDDLDIKGRTFASVKRHIDNAPAVDAVEVVRGRWEDMWGGKYANPRYRCSVCKEKALYKSVQDELLSWHDVQVLTPYCPYCMAKLDGGKDNDI